MCNKNFTNLALILIILSAFVFIKPVFAVDYDPTARPEILPTHKGKLSALPKVKISMIYYTESQSYAVIENRIYRVGEYYGPYEIMKIEPGKVTMQKSGKNYVVKLHKAII